MRQVVHLAVFALFGLSAATALAQGTAAQREACTPDALKLCPGTIPDVAKTTACMKAHMGELSPGCRAAFAAAPPAPPAPAPTTAAPAAGTVPRPIVRETRARRYRPPAGHGFANPDAEIRYVPPRRVIEPPVYGEPGPVIFPDQPHPDGGFCSPPYDFCGPDYIDPYALE